MSQSLSAQVKRLLEKIIKLENYPRCRIKIICDSLALGTDHDKMSFCSTINASLFCLNKAGIDLQANVYAARYFYDNEENSFSRVENVDILKKSMISLDIVVNVHDSEEILYLETSRAGFKFSLLNTVSFKGMLKNNVSEHKKFLQNKLN